MPSPRRLLVLALVLCAGFALAGETVARVWAVEGHSMEPEVSDGSLLLVDAFGPHVSGYQRGDIVILRTPRDAQPTPRAYLVKRVIAVAGEEVRIAAGRVSVNGRALDEPYLPAGTLTSLGNPALVLDETVPPGAVFVLGDHRANSLDSKAFGPVPVDSLVGRVWLIVGPGGAEVPMTSPEPAAAAVKP